MNISKTCLDILDHRHRRPTISDERGEQQTSEKDVSCRRRRRRQKIRSIDNITCRESVILLFRAFFSSDTGLTRSLFSSPRLPFISIFSTSRRARTVSQRIEGRAAPKLSFANFSKTRLRPRTSLLFVFSICSIEEKWVDINDKQTERSSVDRQGKRRISTLMVFSLLLLMRSTLMLLLLFSSMLLVCTERTSRYFFSALLCSSIWSVMMTDRQCG